MSKRLSTRYLMIAVAALFLVSAACTCGDLTELTGGGGGGGGGRGAYDGGDGLDTNTQGSISVGGSASGSLDGIFEADNFTFDGQSGQTVTINVAAQGDTDPRVKLIDPSGNVIGEDDDGGGNYDSQLTATLPTSGTYTIRIDVFTAGGYTLTLQ